MGLFFVAALECMKTFYLAFVELQIYIYFNRDKQKRAKNELNKVELVYYVFFCNLFIYAFFIRLKSQVKLS